MKKKTNNNKKNSNIISKDMQIDEVISKYPELTEVFMNYGLHCVGCSMAGWESIEQGAQAHGFDKKRISYLIKESNDYIKTITDEQRDPNSFNVTKRASSKTVELIKKSKAKFLRIAVLEVPYGIRFGFKYEKRKKKDDVIIIKNKAPYIIDKESELKLHGSTLDYLPHISGFKIYQKHL